MPLSNPNQLPKVPLLTLRWQNYLGLLNPVRQLQIPLRVPRRLVLLLTITKSWLLLLRSLLRRFPMPVQLTVTLPVVGNELSVRLRIGPPGQFPEVRTMFNMVTLCLLTVGTGRLPMPVLTSLIRLAPSCGKIIRALGLFSCMPHLTIPGLLVASTRLTQTTLRQPQFVRRSLSMAGLMILLTTCRCLVLSSRGSGSQVFTLFAPGFPLLLQVCPRLRVTGKTWHRLLRIMINTEHLGFIRYLLKISPLLFSLNTLATALLVLGAARVTMIFPLFRRLPVPTIMGWVKLPNFVNVDPRLANALRPVAGMRHPPTKPSVQLPEFLSRVVLRPGLKTPKLVPRNVLMILVYKVLLGLINA